MDRHFVVNCNCIQMKKRPLLKRLVWLDYCIVPFVACFDYGELFVVELCSCAMDGVSIQLAEIGDRLVSVQVAMKMWMKMRTMRKN